MRIAKSEELEEASHGGQSKRIKSKWSQVKPFPSEFFGQLQQDRALVYTRYQNPLKELRHGLLLQREFKS
jgi:hypothetical protein